MDKSQIIMLIVAGVALVLFVVRIISNRKDDEDEVKIKKTKEKKRIKKNTIQKIEIPDNRGNEKYNMNLQKNKLDLFEEQTFDNNYEQYDGDDGDETIMESDWKRYREDDGDATIKISRDIYSIQLNNLSDPTQIYRKPIHDALVIGRKEGSDVIITTDKTISSRHCRIVKKDEESFYIEDCNSTNGTFVNQSRIAGRKKIGDGDILEIGKSQFKISIIKS